MDSSKVLMLGALGVGGYLAYRWYQNQAAVAAAPATPAPRRSSVLAALTRAAK